MSNNKITSYLLYALGEIILVVFGILIAVSLNNWNANRKEMQVSEQTYRSLIIELEEVKSKAITALEYIHAIVENSMRYINGDDLIDTLKQNPRIIFSWTNYKPVSFDLPILTQETSSNRLIIQDDELTGQLRAINSAHYNLKSNLGYLDEFWNSQVSTYFVRNKKMVFFFQSIKGDKLNLEDVISIYKDEEHRNLCAMSNLLTGGLNDSLRLLIARIDEVLSREK